MKNRDNDSKSNFSSPDEKLDRALAQWGEGKTAGLDHLKQLQERVQSTMADQTITTRSHESGLRSKSRRTVWWAAAIAAAIVGIALTIWIDRSFNNATRLVDGQDVPPKLSMINVEKQQSLLSQFREVFGPQLIGVADIGGDLELFLHGEEGNSNYINSDKYLALKLTLVSRQGNQVWKTVETVDLISSQEEIVQISAAKEHALEIAVWTYQVESDLVSIDLNCKLNGMLDLHIRTSGLQRTGEIANVFSKRIGETEYRLYQSVVHLNRAAVAVVNPRIGRTKS